MKKYHRYLCIACGRECVEDVDKLYEYVKEFLKSEKNIMVSLCDPCEKRANIEGPFWICLKNTNHLN